MTVNDFNVLGVGSRPAETDAPLLVDANAPLPQPIPDKSFKMVPWWHAQGFNLSRGCKHVELSQGNTGDGGETAAGSRFVELTRIFVPERRNHVDSILRLA